MRRTNTFKNYQHQYNIQTLIPQSSSTHNFHSIAKTLRYHCSREPIITLLLYIKKNIRTSQIKQTSPYISSRIDAFFHRAYRVLPLFYSFTRKFVSRLPRFCRATLARVASFFIRTGGGSPAIDSFSRGTEIPAGRPQCEMLRLLWVFTKFFFFFFSVD